MAVSEVKRVGKKGKGDVSTTEKKIWTGGTNETTRIKT